MASPPSYSKEVWHALRELWESTPKVSWSMLRKSVSELMNCECPSEQAISAKSKREKWKKKPIRKRSRAAVEKLLRAGVEPQQESDAEDDCAAIDSGAFVDGDFVDVSHENDMDFPLNPMPVLNEAKRIQSAVERVVWRHRRQAAKVGNLIQGAMQALINLERDCPRPDANDPLLSEKLETRHALLSSVDAEIRMLVNLAQAGQTQQKIEREAWGIESSGDDGEATKRKANTALLEEQTKSARSGLAAQKAALFDRMKLIESGEIFKRGDDDDEFTDG